MRDLFGVMHPENDGEDRIDIYTLGNLPGKKGRFPSVRSKPLLTD
jgi:hypothetical protein